MDACRPRGKGDGALELSARKEMTLFADNVYVSQQIWQLHLTEASCEGLLFQDAAKHGFLRWQIIWEITKDEDSLQNTDGRTDGHIFSKG